MWLLPRRAFLRNAPFSVSLGALDAAFFVLVEALRLRRRLRAMEKNSIFEPFFGDSTLTFLTFGYTFRLSILPTRRAVLLGSAPNLN